jgi:polyhydroxybutyrate depolymerase
MKHGLSARSFALCILLAVGCPREPIDPDLSGPAAATSHAGSAASPAVSGARSAIDTVATSAAGPEPAADGCESITPGDHDATLAFAGLSRAYRIHVPTGHDGGPMPLVLSMHGLSIDGPVQQLFDAMDAVADEHGFAVVYPSSDSGSWNAGACCNPEGPDDVAFMRLLIDEVRRQVCVDPKRIYATGMSNGALMSQRLACEAADLFAAVAPVSGPLVLPEAQCNPVRPISVMAVYGTNDTLVGLEDSGYLPVVSTPGAVIPSGRESTSAWARRLQCANSPAAPTPKSAWPTSPISGGLVPGSGGWIPDEFARNSFPLTPGANCEWYAGCADGAEVGLCTHDGGHDWPTGTSAAIWSFFERHALP